MRAVTHACPNCAAETPDRRAYASPRAGWCKRCQWRSGQAKSRPPRQRKPAKVPACGHGGKAIGGVCRACYDRQRQVQVGRQRCAGCGKWYMDASRVFCWACRKGTK